jgi:hypothetical protein
VDNKTMLEGLKSGSVLTYSTAGEVVDPASGDGDLGSIDSVTMYLLAASDGARSPFGTTAVARVGR